MGAHEQDFFNKDSFVVMGNTRRMRDAFKGLKMMGKTVYFMDLGFAKDESAGKFSKLEDLPGPVDAAICDGSPEKLEYYTEAAVKAGIKAIWYNFQTRPRVAAVLARKSGLDVYEGQCAVVWLPTWGPHHSMHRMIWKWLGRY